MGKNQSKTAVQETANVNNVNEILIPQEHSTLDIATLVLVAGACAVACIYYGVKRCQTGIVKTLRRESAIVAQTQQV